MVFLICLQGFPFSEQCPFLQSHDQTQHVSHRAFRNKHKQWKVRSGHWKLICPSSSQETNHSSAQNYKVNNANFIFFLPNKYFEDHSRSTNPIYQEFQRMQKQFDETQTNCNNGLIVLSRRIVLWMSRQNVPLYFKFCWCMFQVCRANFVLKDTHLYYKMSDCGQTIVCMWCQYKGKNHLTRHCKAGIAWRLPLSLLPWFWPCCPFKWR